MKTINDIKEINTNKTEGKLLLTAMALLTNDTHQFQEVIDDLNELSEEMFKE